MLSIMVIDDSEADQYLAKHVIEEYDPGIDVLQAYDGKEALEILKDLPKQPDVIFLDVNMPRMNGHEFLEEYDKWSVQSVVVVMLTSSDQEIDMEKSKAYKSVINYFTKPLSVSSLEIIPPLAKNKNG